LILYSIDILYYVQAIHYCLVSEISKKNGSSKCPAQRKQSGGQNITTILPLPFHI